MLVGVHWQPYSHGGVACGLGTAFIAAFSPLDLVVRVFLHVGVHNILGGLLGIHYLRCWTLAVILFHVFIVPVLA